VSVCHHPRAVTRTRPKLAALVVVALLAAPAGAWAQGSVDEQYRESFPGQDDDGSDTSQPAPGDDTAPPTPSGTAPAAAPAPEQTSTSTTGELPRTGLPAVLIAVTGGAFVAAGTALRRRSR
jgi:hypothetical protein